MSRQEAFDALPEHMRWRADVAGNGELLWPREAALEALEWLEREAFGVLGFEVYGRLKQARGSFQREWMVEPGWLENEPWEDYVRRAARSTRREIDADTRRRVEPDVAGEVADRRYFIAVVAGDAYPDSLRER